MDLEELRAFVAVAETGSYLAAADAIGMSRTTLRRKVDALEARAGVSLLEGTSRGVVLTEAGQALAAQGRRMMQEMRAVLTTVRDLGSAPRGTLRCVVPTGMPPARIALIAGVMREAFPSLQVACRVAEDPLRVPIDEVDLVTHFADAPPGAGWVSYPLLVMRQWLVASPAYLARRGAPSSVAALAEHDLLSWHAPEDDPTRWALVDGGYVDVRPAMLSSDVHLLRCCCAAGLGIAFLPDALLPDEAGQELVPVLAGVVGRERTLRISAPKALAEVPKIRIVLERVRALAPAT